jgi:serine/threonine-protein kinase
MHPLPRNPGDLVADKYRVERVIGEGGMGVVLEVQHRALGQRFAVKLLQASGPDAATRFLREARAASRLRSEHVARVHDVGELEGGLPYMVMELLEGSDLAQLLEARGPLPIEHAVGYLLQAGEALAEAHSMGIVHRDLKPANLFLCVDERGRERVKLLDFGVSKDLLGEASAVNLTSTDAVVGSPMYIAPEQLVSSRDVDHRADLWSLGVTLHELLTGEGPFDGRTIAELHSAILRDEPERLRSKRHELPAELEAVVMRCLEKDAELRFADVLGLAQALASYAPAQAQVSLPQIERLLEADAGATDEAAREGAVVVRTGSGERPVSAMAATHASDASESAAEFAETEVLVARSEAAETLHHEAATTADSAVPRGGPLDAWAPYQVAAPTRPSAMEKADSWRPIRRATRLRPYRTLVPVALVLIYLLYVFLTDN